ncbi:hypothetical protein BMG523Draft_03536 [Frankia sp. BMG5.23]|nr:hypothetical protein BMG523Draft_03536 [Frankia sp. BMG5.23]
MVDDPDETHTIDPSLCADCGFPLAGAPRLTTRRHQIFDPPPPPRPYVIEYRIVTRVCPCCAATAEGLTPVPLAGRLVWGPRMLARAVWLVCARRLPIRRAAAVLTVMVGATVSAGWAGGVRARAARLLENTFLPHVRTLIAAAPVAHADETTARADGALRYVHVAATDYLTAMHTGDRTAEAIDAGGIWPAFTGVLMRDGYNGYTHLTRALHAWCGAHYPDVAVMRTLGRLTLVAGRATWCRVGIFRGFRGKRGAGRGAGSGRGWSTAAWSCPLPAV